MGSGARVMNFTRMQTWIRIILPQAIPPIIPIMGNYLIVIFKETPILAAISIGEVLVVGEGYGSQYFRILEPITIVGVLFLLMSYPSSVLVEKLGEAVESPARIFLKVRGDSDIVVIKNEVAV